MFNATPGPWYSWPWYKKAYKWIRYQPLFKLHMAYEYCRYYIMWHLEYKYYPIAKGFAPDREHPNGELLPIPSLMRELTIYQDSDRLENYYTLTPSEASGLDA